MRKAATPCRRPISILAEVSKLEYISGCDRCTKTGNSDQMFPVDPGQRHRNTSHSPELRSRLSSLSSMTASENQTVSKTTDNKDSETFARFGQRAENHSILSVCTGIRQHSTRIKPYCHPPRKLPPSTLPALPLCCFSRQIGTGNGGISDFWLERELRSESNEQTLYVETFSRRFS